jgi:flagellar protein FlbT
MARQLLERSLALAEQDEWYQALRLVRHVMRHEATVLGLDAATGLPVPLAGIAAAAVAASAARPHID